MQFPFNKSAFLAHRRREEPLLAAAVGLDEVLNASRESMASCLQSSLSASAVETAVGVRDKRRRGEISMTLRSSDIERLVLSLPTLMGPVPAALAALFAYLGLRAPFPRLHLQPSIV